MATRQYIGARYVPKFYQNSVDGSAQWESNVVYEPLTYVTLTNGHMYISKKQVPATIGSPVNNIEYWLDIGSYNGFIEQLQDEIDDINNVVVPALQDDIALKQNITDNALTTTSKTVVGAINELDSDVGTLQSDITLKQNITDNTLTTTNKTVVGAINELDSEVGTLNGTTIPAIEGDIENLAASMVDVTEGPHVYSGSADCSDNAIHVVASFELEADKLYYVFTSCQFEIAANSSDGEHWFEMEVSTNPNLSVFGRSRLYWAGDITQYVTNADARDTYLSNAFIIKPTANTTYYLYVRDYKSVSATVNAYPCVQAINFD